MEWKEVRLGDVCSAIIDNRGKSAPTSEEGTYPLLEVNCIGNYRPDYSSVRKYVTEDVYNNWFRSGHPKYGDILIPTVGSIGILSLMDNSESCIAQNVIALRIDDKLAINEYIYYYLKTPRVKKEMLNLNIGGVQPSIKVPHLKTLGIPLPDLATQRRISSILSTLDRKIELNNKINATLEEMAQALFKSWFVDFEPFKNGNFIDTEIGKIPEGLTIALINDIPHLLETGRRPKGGVGTITSGVPSVGAEHVKGMGKYDFSKTKYIPAEYANTLKSGKINGYELLIYKDGGKPGYFIPNYSIFGEGYPFEECYLNEHVFKLDFEAGKWFNVFCYFYFQTDYVMNYLNAQGGKAAIPGINQNDVRSLYIFTPENDKVQEFGKSVLPLFKQILKNLSQNRTLTHLRDTLLPRLMSGEIEV